MGQFHGRYRGLLERRTKLHTLACSAEKLKSANKVNQLELKNKVCCSHISADSMHEIKFYTFKQSVTHKQTLQTRSYKMASGAQQGLEGAPAWKTCSNRYIHTSTLSNEVLIQTS